MIMNKTAQKISTIMLTLIMAVNMTFATACTDNSKDSNIETDSEISTKLPTEEVKEVKETGEEPVVATVSEDEELKWQANQKAQDMVDELTLREKIGQMIIVSFRKWTDTPEDPASVKNVTVLNDSLRKVITDSNVGGVILFAENCDNTAQIIELTEDIKATSMQSDCKIRAFVAIDQEGGSVTRYNQGAIMMGNMALGALNSVEDTKECAGLIGKDLSALGIDINFAPDIDINNNPANPVIGTRSFSSNPNIVASMGEAYIDGLHRSDTVACVKHFPGHGDTDTDSHTGLPCINKTRQELDAFELVPFRSCTVNGLADMVMTAHIQYPLIENNSYVSIKDGSSVYLPATFSRKIITDILRKDYGYDGVVVTDSMRMDAVTEHFDSKDGVCMAINAGADMLLMPVEILSDNDTNLLNEYIDMIEDAVNKGRIEESRIDEAVTRILTLKIYRGVLSPDTRSVEERVAVAEDAVDESIIMDISKMEVTMLKNEGSLLPITSGRVLALVPDIQAEAGINIAKDNLINDGTINDDTLVIKEYKNKAAADFTEELRNADYVLIFSQVTAVGQLNSEGSKGKNARFIDEMTALTHENNKKVILASMSLPYDAGRYSDADAILLGYSSKYATVSEGEDNQLISYGAGYPAVVYDIFGNATPRGKSPVDIYSIDKAGNISTDILYKNGSGLTY